MNQGTYKVTVKTPGMEADIQEGEVVLISVGKKQNDGTISIHHIGHGTYKELYALLRAQTTELHNMLSGGKVTVQTSDPS